MKGYCHLTQIPVRAEAKSSAEMTTQLLYGETYTILKNEGEWLFIETNFDEYQGWLSSSSFKAADGLDRKEIQQELFAVHPLNDRILVCSMGSEFFSEELDYDELKTKDVKELSCRFLGVPYLWGGRTFTGIDCSGFVQIVYKCLGEKLFRDASQQVTQGKSIRFENVIQGDLVFFESNYKVTHVGIALSRDTVIHAHGEVRIDKLDKNGIYNEEKGIYTHKFHSARRIG